VDLCVTWEWITHLGLSCENGLWPGLEPTTSYHGSNTITPSINYVVTCSLCFAFASMYCYHNWLYLVLYWSKCDSIFIIIWLIWWYTHTRLMALCPGLTGWAGTRKVKPIWILLKQETLSGSGISWAICRSAPRSRQITTPAPNHSVFYRPDALPATQPTASKHWKHWLNHICEDMCHCGLDAFVRVPA